jgi:arsenate reductase (thioredoxin)
MSRARVLFLCTGNSARSQMAEAFLKNHGGESYEAYSAGTEPKGLHPYAERVMSEVGVSLTGQYSKHVREYMGRMHFAYVITLCDEVEKSCPAIFPGMGQRLHWSFEDPAAFVGSEDGKLARFREVRDGIERRIKQWLAEQEGPAK